MTNNKQTNSILKSVKNLSTQSNSGFTLIEVLVVVIIIGVLSTIAAPSWLAFVNRQRVNKVNDAILSSLQDAQREARRTKTDYSASFRANVANESEVAVHRTGTPPAAASPLWKSLTADLGVNPNQVLLFSNLGGANQADQKNIIAANDVKTITFNYLGALPNDAELGPAGAVDPPGLVVGVGVPDNNGGVIAATERCVKVRTLIGGMQTGSGDAECP
ncbi:MAG: prepilin-type N-terminal cleavage/methylation domain-containing protein [Symploca sp. SIO2D2]|nr:prepilin-type N-terminal cleavage/methylation domain-containing protein [Symploca sp. SIO2D2]